MPPPNSCKLLKKYYLFLQNKKVTAYLCQNHYLF